MDDDVQTTNNVRPLLSETEMYSFEDTESKSSPFQLHFNKEYANIIFKEAFLHFQHKKVLFSSSNNCLDRKITG